jgi:hypothetical protein
MCVSATHIVMYMIAKPASRSVSVWVKPDELLMGGEVHRELDRGLGAGRCVSAADRPTALLWACSDRAADWDFLDKCLRVSWSGWVGKLVREGLAICWARPVLVCEARGASVSLVTPRLETPHRLASAPRCVHDYTAGGLG